MLQNRRLNSATRAQQLGSSEGLRLASRRSALPKARRRDVTAATAGSVLIILCALLLAA